MRGIKRAWFLGGLMVINHLIIVKWKDKIEKGNHLLEDIENIFSPIKEIKGIYEISYISNVVDRPNRYDLIIKIKMDLDSLPLYDESPAHKLWKEKYSQYIESKAIFDYEE